MRKLKLPITSKFEDYLTTSELLALAKYKLYRNYTECDSGQSTKCKIWNGSRDIKYGKMYIKVIDGYEVFAYVHRLAWFLEHGSIPSFDITSGLRVLHGPCNNPLCFELSHLSLGTAKKNGEDMIRDGTSNQGEQSPVSVLTEANVREIYNYAHNSSLSFAQIADMYNIHRATVYDIKTRRSWKHLSYSAE